MQSNSSDCVTDAAEAGANEKTSNAPPTDHAPQSNSLTGEFRHHQNFASQFLDHNRNVIVYLPPGYDREEHRRYPVLYLNDGQNLFDKATAFGGVEWGVDKTAQSLIEAGRVAQLIIAGIYNTGEHRIEEYTPTVDPKMKKGGKADAYGRFLVEELKPFLDRRYRTLPRPEHTGLGGSSLGGLVSIYVGLKYPQVFGKLMVMSPSVWWDRGVILRVVEGVRAKPSTRIWLDIGTKEGKFTPGHVRRLRDLFVTQGWRHDADLKYLEVKGGQHNEADWGKRVGPALEFLFPR